MWAVCPGVVKTNIQHAARRHVRDEGAWQTFNDTMPGVITPDQCVREAMARVARGERVVAGPAARAGDVGRLAHVAARDVRGGAGDLRATINATFPRGRKV